MNQQSEFVTATAPRIEPERAATSIRRLAELDALRGLAACSVLAYHFTDNYEHYRTGFDRDPWLFVPWGHWGVALFFMISGFVIPMTIERKNSIGDFVSARFARLYPAYWASVTLAFVVGWAGIQPVAWQDAAINLTMLQQAFGVANASSVYWTLYIELLFYLVVAISILVGRKRQLGWWLFGFLAIDTLATFPEAWDRVPGWWRLTVYFPLLRHLPLFVFGLWVYRGWYHGDRWWPTVAGLCLLNRVGHGAGWEEASTVAALGTVFGLAVWGQLPWLKWSPLLWLGKISYSLYLVHLNLGFLVIDRLLKLGFTSDAAIVVATAASLAAAWLAHAAVEQPAHDRLMKWLRNRRRRLIIVAPQEPLQLAASPAGARTIP